MKIFSALLMISLLFVPPVFAAGSDDEQEDTTTTTTALSKPRLPPKPSGKPVVPPKPSGFPSVLATGNDGEKTIESLRKRASSHPFSKKRFSIFGKLKKCSAPKKLKDISSPRSSQIAIKRDILQRERAFSFGAVEDELESPSLTSTQTALRGDRESTHVAFEKRLEECGNLSEKVKNLYKRGLLNKEKHDLVVKGYIKKMESLCINSIRDNYTQLRPSCLQFINMEFNELLKETECSDTIKEVIQKFQKGAKDVSTTVKEVAQYLSREQEFTSKAAVSLRGLFKLYAGYSAGIAEFEKSSEHLLKTIGEMIPWALGKSESPKFDQMLKQAKNSVDNEGEVTLPNIEACVTTTLKRGPKGRRSNSITKPTVIPVEEPQAVQRYINLKEFSTNTKKIKAFKKVTSTTAAQDVQSAEDSQKKGASSLATMWEGKKE